MRTRELTRCLFGNGVTVSGVATTEMGEVTLRRPPLEDDALVHSLACHLGDVRAREVSVSLYPRCNVFEELSVAKGRMGPRAHLEALVHVEVSAA